jgi:hypothetical protein
VPHWLLHVLGLDVPPGVPYDFWSGVGGDLVYLSAIGVLFHHLNCHEKRCWRIARHSLGGFCRKHRKGSHDEPDAAPRPGGRT